MIAAAHEKSIRIRIPDALKKALKVRAKRNGRSFNSEVLMRLSQSLQGPRSGPV